VVPCADTEPRDWLPGAVLDVETKTETITWPVWRARAMDYGQRNQE